MVIVLIIISAVDDQVSVPAQKGDTEKSDNLDSHVSQNHNRDQNDDNDVKDVQGFEQSDIQTAKQRSLL